MGNFRATSTFFREHFPLLEFFRPVREYFLGVLGLHEFFSQDFPLHKYIFMMLHQRPPPK